MQAYAHRSRAHVLAHAGRTREAREELEQALRLWERYGYTGEAERARTLLAAGEPPAPTPEVSGSAPPRSASDRLIVAIAKG